MAGKRLDKLQIVVGILKVLVSIVLDIYRVWHG